MLSISQQVKHEHVTAALQAPVKFQTHPTLARAVFYKGFQTASVNGKTRFTFFYNLDFCMKHNLFSHLFFWGSFL